MSTQQSVGLKKGALGLAGLATMGAVMMAPALGILGNWGPMAGIVGQGVPLVFLIAFVVSVPSAISYALLSRKLPSAGSAYSWIARTIGHGTGTWVGLIMALYYLTAVILQPILFGVFFNSLLQFAGMKSPGLTTFFVGVAVVTVLAMITTYRGVSLSGKTVMITITIESLIVLALCVTIFFVKAAHGGLTMAPFEPSHLQGGLTAFWAAMILGILSYTGYDVISTVAEETHAPRKLLPRATALAIVGVTIFWVVCSWVLSISTSVSVVDKYNASNFTAVTGVANAYWGSGRIAIIFVGLSAALGVYVATVVGTSRALYALSRDGKIPSVFGKIHERSQTPWNAMHLVYGLTLVGIAVIVAWQGTAIQAYIWWAGPITFFALMTYIAVNLANLLYFTRTDRSEFNWFLNGFVPIVGIGLDGYLVYKSFFVSLWSLPFKSGPSIIVFSLICCAGAFLVAVTRGRRNKTLTLIPSSYEGDIADIERPEPAL